MRAYLNAPAPNGAQTHLLPRVSVPRVCCNESSWIRRFKNLLRQSKGSQGRELYRAPSRAALIPVLGIAVATVLRPLLLRPQWEGESTATDFCVQVIGARVDAAAVPWRLLGLSRHIIIFRQDHGGRIAVTLAHVTVVQIADRTVIFFTAADVDVDRERLRECSLIPLRGWRRPFVWPAALGEFKRHRWIRFQTVDQGSDHAAVEFRVRVRDRGAKSRIRFDALFTLFEPRFERLRRNAGKFSRDVWMQALGDTGTDAVTQLRCRHTCGGRPGGLGLPRGYRRQRLSILF